jgi:hypothetical protein
MRPAGLPNRKHASWASPPNFSAFSPLPAIEMSILGGFASKHGATGESAERIAHGLRAAGRPVDDLGVNGKKALNVMKVQRIAARDELRALQTWGLSTELAALTKRREGYGPDLDAVQATATPKANTAAGFGRAGSTGGLLHSSDSPPVTR